MKSSPSGTSTLASDVTNIGADGFWLLVDNREYFVPFADYPVFKTATIEQIFKIERVGPDQYHWPLLDADVELGALEHPQQFPLVYR